MMTFFQSPKQKKAPLHVETSSDGPIAASPTCSPRLQRTMSSPVLRKICVEEGNKLLSNSEPKRVLIVDDNLINHTVLERALKKLNIPLVIQHANDGLEAIKLCDKAKQEGHLYDVVFMDIEMPHNGYKATYFIRNILGITAKQMPIIACTSLESAEVKAKCLDVGMNAHLPKPVNYELLKTQLKQVTNVLPEPMSVSNEENHNSHRRLSATV